MSERIVVNLVMNDVLPGRVVRIPAVIILYQYDVVRVEYDVAPPMAPFPRDASDMDQTIWEERNVFETLIRDDLGTVFDSWGGATGLSPDGTRTHGEFDYHPAPPANARILEIVFSAGGVRGGERGLLYVLRIDIRLNTSTVDRRPSSAGH
jgi:hypothetical protein